MKLPKMSARIRFWLWLLVAFLLGAGAFWLTNYLSNRSDTLSESAIHLPPTKGETLISPLLACGGTEDVDTEQYQSLKDTINKIISQKESAGAASDISVYFRDFEGSWLGIGDSESYVPASLLKVPLMIAYYKLSESDPSLLSKKIVYDGSFNNNTAEYYVSANDLKPGSYTVEQLIDAMIEYSDNNAEALLADNIDPNTLSEVYTDLGLNLSADDNPGVASITAKQYSGLFRILYNATYLSDADSEHALELLTKTDFDAGLDQTVGTGTPVAEKFGERSVLTIDGGLLDRELHDCGIVYGPDHPYLLCIMTRGSDFDSLSDVIRTIGTAVYNAEEKD